MSIFSYNGISLALIKTRLFKVEGDRDPSGVDHLWNKFTIHVTGLLGPTPITETKYVPGGQLVRDASTAAELAVTLGLNEAAAVAAARAAAIAATEAAKPRRTYSFTHIDPSNDPTGFLNDVKHKLSIPRKQLFFQNGNLVVKCDGVDANLGPNPTALEVRQMVNGYFLVEWGGTVCLADCLDNPFPSPVVSLKWSQSESFDENWLSRLTTSGRLIVRSDLKTSADSFRNLCVPGMLTDYVRQEVNFTLSPTGTELDFRVVDQERVLNPPYGANTARGRFTVILARGAKRTGQIDIRLTGPKGGSRADLMAIATRMAMSKLESEQRTPAGEQGAALIYDGSFSEELFENAVHVQMQALLQQVKRSDRGPIRSIGNTPGVAQGQIPLAPPVRSRLLTLLAPAFYDPCSATPGAQPERSTTPATSVTVTNPDGTTTTTTVPGTSAPGSQLVSGGEELLSPSPAVLGSSVAAITPVGPAAVASSYGLPVYNITISDLPDDPAVLDALQLDQAPYDSYEIESAYTYDSGRVQMPGTGVGTNGEDAFFPRRHGGMMQMEVTWVASRKGQPPVLPKFISGHTNFVELTGAVCPQQIDVTADSESPVFTVSGHYVYGVKKPSQVNAAAPIPPFLSDATAAASPQAVGFFSDRILWQFQGSGPNPFTTTVVDQQPNKDVMTALGAFLSVAGIPTPPAPAG